MTRCSHIHNLEIAIVEVAIECQEMQHMIAEAYKSVQVRERVVN